MEFFSYKISKLKRDWLDKEYWIIFQWSSTDTVKNLVCNILREMQAIQKMEDYIYSLIRELKIDYKSVDPNMMDPFIISGVSIFPIPPYNWHAIANEAKEGMNFDTRIAKRNRSVGEEAVRFHSFFINRAVNDSNKSCEVGLEAMNSSIEMAKDDFSLFA